MEGAAVQVALRRPHPLGIERAHHLFGVERVSNAGTELRFDVRLTLGAVRKLQAEPPVERDRSRHVADDDREDVELWAHDASAVSAVRNPSSPAIGCIASTTLRMCSSRSIPRRSAPAYTSSRWTPAANDGCFSFFFTDFGSSPSRPVGRTSPHAWTKPHSSAAPQSARFSLLRRGRA